MMAQLSYTTRLSKVLFTQFGPALAMGIALWWIFAQVMASASIITAIFLMAAMIVLAAFAVVFAGRVAESRNNEAITA